MNELNYSMLKEQYEGCIRLWKAVLIQLLTDFKSTSKKKCNNYLKKRVKLYVSGNVDNLKLICDYADVDYKKFLKNIINLINSEDKNDYRKY